MIAVRYRIELDEPVLVTALSGDPNSAVAFDYLPGSVLRGAWISHVFGRQLVQDSLIRRRFFDGTTRFLNAYPLSDNQRMLPTPRSWYRADDQIYDTLLGAQPPSDRKRERVKPFFHLRSATNIHLHTPEHQIAIHIERSRVGVPHGNEGQVYRYDSLASGAGFEGIVLCVDRTDADYFAQYLSQPVTLWLGGARSAGYGRTSWSLIDVDDHWRESPQTRNHQAGEWLVLLLSPVLIRDAFGQYAADQPTLENHLRQVLGSTVSVIDSALNSEMIGGFNRKWGLPLPQIVAVSPGSVLKITPPDPSSAAILERMGLGERRLDGFGRVAVYQQAEKQFSVTPPAIQAVAGSGSGVIGIKFLDDRIRRDRLRLMIMVRAQALTIKQAPRATQLNALRESAALGIRAVPPDTTAARSFLVNVNERHLVRKQFEEARIDGHRLIDWLNGLLNGSVEQKLTLRIPDDKASFDPETALRLLDAVLARAVRTPEKRR